MSTVRTTNIVNASSATTNLVLDAFGNVTVGGVIDGLSTPAVATGTGSSSGGTLAAATYYVRIVAFDSAGNTTNAGPESTGVTTTGSTSSIAYTWAAITGATGYRVYFSTTSGTYTSYFVTTSASYTLTTTSGGISAGLPASNTTGISLMPNQSFLRNKIINGDMRIDQRNAGASVSTTTTSANVYTLDRWAYYVTAASKFTVQQNAGSVTSAVGFPNYLGVTSTSAYAVASGDILILRQAIEGLNVSDLGWGSANARTVTLSFWVRSSLTGTFGGSVCNNAGDRSYPFSYSISSANTWTQISVTVPGDTTGTWLTNNGVGIYVQISVGTGTTFSGTAGSWAATFLASSTGATSVVGTNGATFYITGVQLEVGSVATPFERRQYGTELMLCQRYFWIDRGWPDNTATARFYSGGAFNATQSEFVVRHPVTMRTGPTLTASAASTFAIYLNNTYVTPTSVLLYAATINNALIYTANPSVTVGWSANLASNPSSTTTYLAYSAEL